MPVILQESVSDFVFVSDSHLHVRSDVRTGDVLQDTLDKYDFVIDYCNRYNAVLLLGGDMFDKPTIPDSVKIRFCQTLKRLRTRCFAIEGNHDRLFNNREFKDRTSYGFFTEAGFWTDLDSIDGVQYDNVFLTSQMPIITRGKPQIILFHGFLNREDGLNTFRLDNIRTSEDACHILLGHLHEPMEDVNYTSKVRIIRPGSLLRDTRLEVHNRIPELVHLRVYGDVIKSKKVPISVARPANEIFKTKEVTITESERVRTYEEIIEKIKHSSNSEVTLSEVLTQVTTPTVKEYILSLL